MRRFVSFATLLVASSLLGGCPIYPADSCYSAYDCSSGYTCDSYLGQCVANPGDDDDDDNVSPPPPTPPGPPVPPPRDRTCSDPAQCEVGETCGEQGYCLPGDCTFWGCVEGFRCVESPEGKSYACAKDGAPPDPAPVCGSSAIAAPAAGTLSLTDGPETLSFCLAGLESDPANGSLLAGGELAVSSSFGAELLQEATLTIKGSRASREIINCNPFADAAEPTRCFLRASNLGLGQTDYASVDEPFSIVVESWTDEAFVGTALGVALSKTVFFSGRPGTEQTLIQSDVKIEVRSVVIEDDGSSNGGNGDDSGGRPPPPLTSPPRLDPLLAPRERPRPRARQGLESLGASRGLAFLGRSTPG